MLFLRRLIDTEPVAKYAHERIYKDGHIHRFDQVAIGTEAIAALYIYILLRCRDYDQWHITQLIIALDILHKLVAIHLGHSYIRQDQARRYITARSEAIKEVYSICTVLDVLDVQREAHLTDRLLYK